MSNEQQAASSPAAQTTESASVLDQILNVGIRPADADEKSQAVSLIEKFVQTQLQPGMVVGKDAQRSINAWMAVIDKKISDQLNQVMHHEDFQKLEGSWRGLHYLVMQTETSTDLKIKVLNVSKKDLLKDLEQAAEFDMSALFKKVYGEEYDVFGGHPFGCLIGDYEFGRHPQDTSLLERIAEVAAAAHAPFLSAASPQMFGLETFTDIGKPRDLAKIFDSVQYAKWKSFRESDDSRYVGLTMPHTLMRLPYGKETVPVDAFDFEEDVDGRDHKKYLWGNAAYALGTRLTESFSKYGWLATIRGVEGGGLVQGLPVHTFETDDGDVAMKCPVEVAIGDRREKELSDLGFIPLLHCKNTDYAAFFGAQSCQKAKKYNTPEANANARLSTALQYLLCVSRFAHYLKAIARDKIGSFMERKDCEVWLNNWINNYTLAKPEIAGPSDKAKKPLREARIDVREDPARPGCYEAVAFLRPHFQMEELSVGLSLVAKLPESRNK
ncbi:type VI secretion system contractile sheath large subunit [Schlesneria paludicola]|uniref:type VI secretion system contractile sheath large subunit n=1 Tax=Schlesneria paludicola TaxID=360056 RepID=UPI00029A377C|nr:type VI secretion system contractile sheath large subunit [Schlesneria paludicola]